MKRPISPLGLVWSAITLAAALYVAARFLFAELERLDYALMALVHLSLAAQVLKTAWDARGRDT